MDMEESFIIITKQIWPSIYIILLYFCHLKQGNGEILCIYSQGNLLYWSQLQKEELKSVLFYFWGPDEIQFYIRYQCLQFQFYGSSNIIRKLTVIYLKRS